MIRAPLLAVLSLALSGSAGLAAGAEEAIASARNQLGVLEYCAGAGHIPAAAAERQRAIFERMPQPGNARAAAAAYAKGQQGIVASMGIEQPISDAARLQNTDVAGLCRQIAARSGG